MRVRVYTAHEASIKRIMLWLGTTSTGNRWIEEGKALGPASLGYGEIDGPRGKGLGTTSAGYRIGKGLGTASGGYRIGRGVCNSGASQPPKITHLLENVLYHSSNIWEFIAPPLVVRRGSGAT